MPYKDKNKAKEQRKEYYEENKEKINKYEKERKKNHHISVIEKICNYYSIKKPICFFDKEKLHRQLREMGKEELIKDEDEKNAL